MFILTGWLVGMDSKKEKERKRLKNLKS
jgi:hypothetical protein